MKINRCGLLCATVTGPSLSVCKKQTHQVYSLLYKLSNSTTYDWPSFLARSTVVPCLNFRGFTYSNLSTSGFKGYVKKSSSRLSFIIYHYYRSKIQHRETNSSNNKQSLCYQILIFAYQSRLITH